MTPLPLSELQQSHWHRTDPRFSIPPLSEFKSNGAFVLEVDRRLSEFTDGLNTVLGSEVLAGRGHQVPCCPGDSAEKNCRWSTAHGTPSVDCSNRLSGPPKVRFAQANVAAVAKGQRAIAPAKKNRWITAKPDRWVMQTKVQTRILLNLS